MFDVVKGTSDALFSNVVGLCAWLNCELYDVYNVDCTKDFCDNLHPGEVQLLTKPKLLLNIYCGFVNIKAHCLIQLLQYSLHPPANIMLSPGRAS